MLRHRPAAMERVRAMRRFAITFLEERATLPHDSAQPAAAGGPFPIAAAAHPPLEFPPSIPGADVEVTRVALSGLTQSGSLAELNWMSGVPA
jgi:hypothetical protein